MDSITGTTTPSKAMTVQTPSLVRSFSLLAFVSVVVFALILAGLVSRFIEHHMLERDASLTRDFVNSVAVLENVTRIFDDHEAGRDKPTHPQFFQHLASMPDVIRANVYTRDKTLLWSSDPTLTGKHLPDNDELDEALKGGLVVKVEEGHEAPVKSEHAHLERAGTFVENYVPLHANDGRGVLGVVEFYRKPEALFATIDAGRRLVWGVALAGAVVLYLALFWIVRRGDLVMRQQQQVIAQAQTMSSLGELASMVAHNVRNPIASIRSTAELAQDLGSLDKGAASDIIVHVDRIEKSLRQILAYATPVAAHVGQADMNELLRQGAHDLARHPDLQVDLQLHDALPPVRGEAALLSQAIHSVISNALDAMPAGGRLQLSTHLIADGGGVETRITDSGGGISSATLSRVFDAFFTTKAKGMGLGLSLARSIVRRYDGDIQIESTLGRGTRVSLNLPLA